MLPLSFIEHAAAQQKISLRTGCVCNPGGAAAIIGIESDMEQLYEGVTLRDFESRVGHELGVVQSGGRVELQCIAAPTAKTFIVRLATDSFLYVLAFA